MPGFTNYGALTDGVKLYLDGMRAVVRRKLKAKYGEDWFKKGVMPWLSDKQSDMAAKQLKEKGLSTADALVDLLEPQIIKQVVLKEFDNAFAGTYANFAATQAYLIQAVNARNKAAHPGSGDLLADDAIEGLRAMARLLKEAGQKEFDQVEALAKLVAAGGIEEAAEVAPEPSKAAPAPPTPPSGSLPYWWQVTEPWDAYKDPAGLDISQFAATLGGVVAGTARKEYLDPVEFFSRTYFTQEVTAMVRDILSRLSGNAGDAAIEMQTPFGGGKTHAELVLYHLIKDPEKSLSVPGVREALGDVHVPAGANIAVIDGMYLGTDAELKEDGTSVSTLWGEIAYQLSPKAYRAHVQDSDAKGQAPGNSVFRKLLDEASPCLILIDELISYLVKLKYANSRRDQNLYRQTVQFLQELLQEAGNAPGVCLLLSLPKSQSEFGGINPAELQQQLGIVDDLRARADRVVSKRTPVSDDEVYTLICRRLFKPADRTVVNKVVDGYYAVYEKDRMLYDPGVFTSDYRRQMVESYPLHPELIDVLYKKWGAQGDFPRTRTVLQLLATVVADQWVSKRASHSIQSSQVNLDRERIRTKVLSAIGNAVANDAVVAADIIGGDAHADGFDERRNGHYAQHHVARGIATTLLLHSAGGRTQNGALPSDLRIGTVSPLLGPEYVDEVMGALEETLWYVHRDGQLLRFQTKQNLFRRIAETAQHQPNHVVDDAIRKEMERAYGESPGFKILQWAGAEGSLPDQAEPSIAILAGVTRHRVSEESGQPVAQDRSAIEALWSKSGGGLRQWRNAVIIVAPDREYWERAEQSMREVLAYESVLDSKGSDALSDGERKDLQARLREKRDSLRTSLVSAYRWVFYPSESTDGQASLAFASLPTATAGETIAKRAVERLESSDYGPPKVLRKMSAMYFDARYAPRIWKKDDELDLAEVSRRFPAWTYLPMLPDREGTLSDCVRDGVKTGLWSVVYGNKETSTFRRLCETELEVSQLPTLFDGAAFLVTGELRDLIRSELTPAEVTPTAILRDGDPEPEPLLGLPPTPTPTTVPAPTKRWSRVRIRVPELQVTKTANLQPYLWKALQTADSGARVSLTVDVDIPAGLTDEQMNKQIVEAFEMLGIQVEWEPS